MGWDSPSAGLLCPQLRGELATADHAGLDLLGGTGNASRGARAPPDSLVESAGQGVPATQAALPAPCSCPPAPQLPLPTRLQLPRGAARSHLGRSPDSDLAHRGRSPGPEGGWDGFLDVAEGEGPVPVGQSTAEKL